MSELVFNPELAALFSRRDDQAYIYALGGNTGPAKQLDDERQGAIKYAAKQMDIKSKNLRGLSSDAPNLAQVTEWMVDDPHLVDLHLCAEILGGRLPIGHRAAKWGQKAAEVVAFGPAALANLASKDLKGSGNKIAAGVAQGVGDLIHVGPRAIEMRLENTEDDLARVARLFVVENYGKHEESFGAATNAAWIWATLLARTSALPPQMAGIPNYYASSLFKAVGATGNKPEDLPYPIRKLITTLVDPKYTITAKTGRTFFENAKLSRQAAQEQYERILYEQEHGKRPGPREQAELMDPTDMYNTLVELPDTKLRELMSAELHKLKQLYKQEDKSDHSRLHASITTILAAMLEQGDAQGDDRNFNFLLLSNQNVLSAVVLRHIMSQDIESHKADVATLRLLSDLRREQWSLIMPDKIHSKLLVSLEKAAFSWFNHPRDTYNHDKGVTRFVKEAYLFARLNLFGFETPSFSKGRAMRFLQAAEQPGAEKVYNSRWFESVFKLAYKKARS